jgi:hypothetical protein
MRAGKEKEEKEKTLLILISTNDSTNKIFSATGMYWLVVGC